MSEAGRHAGSRRRPAQSLHGWRPVRRSSDLVKTVAVMRKDVGGCGCAINGLLTQKLSTGTARPTQSAPAPRARAPATVLRAEAAGALKRLRAEALLSGEPAWPMTFGFQYTFAP